jgi:hypothetical protein
MMKKGRKCVDCGAVAIISAGELGGWLCVECTHERIHAPRNMELAQADEDKTEFEEGGGKLS